MLVYYDGYYPASGGVETYINALCENLPCKFDIVTDLHDKSLGEEPMLPNARVTRIAPRNTTTMSAGSLLNRPPGFAYRLLADSVRYRRTWRHLKSADCSLVHFHGLGVGTSLMKVLMRTSIARALTPLPEAVPRGVPRLLTIHGLSAGGNDSFRAFQRRFLSSFDAFLCVDEHLADAAKRVGAPSSAVFQYIPNSVDTRRFRPLESPSDSPPDRSLRIGFVGRLEASRGIDALRQLVAQLPPDTELHAVVAASDVQMQRFRNHLRGPRVHLRANVPYGEMPDFYRKIDVLFNPVEVPGISRATLEAMATGKPVTMTAIGNRYPVEEGVTGFLFDATKDGIHDLLAKLREQRGRLRTLGEESCRRVNREFSNDVILPRVWAMYEQLSIGA